MKLVKKCLIEFNNKYTNHIKNNEVDDNKQLRFTLLDMQKFAKKYHKQKLILTDVVVPKGTFNCGQERVYNEKRCSKQCDTCIEEYRDN